MNLLPLLLGFALLGSFNKQNKQQAFDLSQILSNPDLANLLPHIAKLFDKNAKEEDKNFAIMNLLTNPAIFEIVQKFVAKNPEKNTAQPQQNQSQENQSQENQQQEHHEQANDNTNFSVESQEFFAPIQEVADKQISKKLYALYDNWYVKK